jgi:hypothetical protein
MRAQAVFLEKVIQLHPHAAGKPCVIGNCQAGWAVMMLAALRPDLFGPIIVAGSPLSYWAGVQGENPMRYLGGLLGGSWLTALMCDLGAGIFDGSYLVSNFENLNPANTLWTKNYNLWSKVDTEAKRFLEFERWWGGHVNLNADEIQWIVDQLFVGNRLATAELVTSDGIRIDLRKIRSPIVCFCSKGDNITPPQQALGWITDLYETDGDLRASEQIIVYAVHDQIGHLGIFVSGGVARKEHDEFASNVDLIDVLPPGLYEVVLMPKTEDVANPNLVRGDWIVRFEPRSINDVRAIVQPDLQSDRRFAAVRRVSEVNLGLYRTLLQPFVRAWASKQSAVWLHKLNPSEAPFEHLSGRNPFMWHIAKLAEQVRKGRHPVSPDNPLLQLQGMVSNWMIAALDGFRDLRDRSMEQIFLALYSSPFVQAVSGVRASDEPPRRRPGVEPERIAFIQRRLAELQERLAQGGAPEAAIRSLVYIGMTGPGVDERAFEVLQQVRSENRGLTLEEFKRVMREQFFALLLDQDAALAAIPEMLPPDATARKDTLRRIRQVVSAAGTPTGARAERLAQIERLYGAPVSDQSKSSEAILAGAKI